MSYNIDMSKYPGMSYHPESGPCPKCGLINSFPLRSCRVCKTSLPWSDKTIDDMMVPITVPDGRQSNIHQPLSDGQRIGLVLLGLACIALGGFLTLYGFSNALGGDGNWLWKIGFVFLGTGVIIVGAGFSAK